MGIKVQNLKRLVSNKINVHEYEELKTYDELLEYSLNHNQFSIRFDRNVKEKDLPFYTYDKDKINDSKTYFMNIIKEMEELGCTLLCSNGHAYDDKLKFNFVIDISDNLDFILELCDKKIPLRFMYKYKTTIIKGNLLEQKYKFINKEDNRFSIEDIDYILKYLFNKKYKYVEGTLYEETVGILKEKIIVWQTD